MFCFRIKETLNKQAIGIRGRAMAQRTFAELEYEGKKKQTRREKFLARMEDLIPWERLEERIRPYYPQAGRGRRPYALAVMLRVHCVQLFYNVSDPGMEDMLYEIESVRRFVGLRLGDALPDETTILNFRHLLERHELGGKLMAEINAHLAEQGLRLREGTILEATIIAAPSSTKNKKRSRDPQMHQTKKGNQWYFGMKAHIGVDAETGLTHSVAATAANVADVTQGHELLHGNSPAARLQPLLTDNFNQPTRQNHFIQTFLKAVAFLFLLMPFVAKAQLTVRGDDVLSYGKLCTHYTVLDGGVVPTTISLYLGEGADQYRELIELAAEKWNATVYAAAGLGYRLFRVKDQVPLRYQLPENFWDNVENDLYLQSLHDNQNVIYFKNSGRPGLDGFTSGGDIYINTYQEEQAVPGQVIVNTHKLTDLGDGRGLYLAVNRIYLSILHEMGHMVGLKDMPVFGNVMSPQPIQSVVAKWQPLAELANQSPMLNVEDVGIIADNNRFNGTDIIDDPEELELVDMFTRTMSIGEQEQMLLPCIYRPPQKASI